MRLRASLSQLDSLDSPSPSTSTYSSTSSNSSYSSTSSASPSPHAYHPTFLLSRQTHRHIFYTALLVHVASLLACAAASGLSPSATSASTSSAYHSLPCRPHTSPIHNAASSSKNVTSSQCVFWSPDESPRELCSVDTTSRVQRLRETYLFPRLQPISLYEVLAAGSRDRDIPSRLRPGVAGADCLHDDADRCRACFQGLATSLRRLDAAYASFDAALLRFDCLPAVDTASATRPFSPNGSCTTCRSWYRRWLLVQTVQLWRAAPCVNWCYYAQLACPHLATSKVVDYAGHPSFQCRDQDIPSSRETASRCECLHPCDLRGVVPTGGGSSSTSTKHHRRSDHDAHQQHDFYAAEAHCKARERQCARSTAHERRARSGGSAHLPPSLVLLVLVAAVIRP